MTIRTAFAGIATAFVLGAGALIGGTLAGATSAEAAPGWRGGHGHHGHFGGGFHHRRHGWGGRGWGYRPVYAGYYGGCYTVLRARFVPGYGIVERPVTRCD
jgi:hypothetical protein